MLSLQRVLKARVRVGIRSFQSPRRFLLLQAQVYLAVRLLSYVARFLEPGCMLVKDIRPNMSSNKRRGYCIAKVLCISVQ